MKTILMIHGWNYLNYNKFNNKDAWSDRSIFVDKLSKHFNIIKINLPGFGGQKEPNEKHWNLDNYADYINSYLINKKVDYILGYSFGAAVAVAYKLKYKSNVKLILVSSAINRKYRKSIGIINTPKAIEWFRKIIRDMYLIYIVKNNFVKYGTNFLRETYQNIVRVDLTDNINKIDLKEICFIYGEKDEIIDSQKLIKELPKYQDRIKFIKNGEHDIANTHPDEILNYINELFKRE